MANRPRNELNGPHGAFEASCRKEEFALELFDRLWSRYRERVSYVSDYERIVHDSGATFVNDHIAFRTFANQHPHTGITTISRIFEALGYRAAGCYQFEGKHLNAVHFQHSHPCFPKLFFSELKTWELGFAAQQAISATLSSHRQPIADRALTRLISLDDDKQRDWTDLMDTVLMQFHELPWELPAMEHVIALNKESQYAAWVLVHGYNVNHFTSLINSHDVDELDDIEKTIQALQATGVPMKDHIEGEKGSKLRQSATAAVVIDVEVLDGGSKTCMPWTYAYFELAERNRITDPATGEAVRFEGFLGPQATNLFEMTRRS